MAQIIEVSADETTATKFLESYIQSGNINFLIGSGASSPAIKVAGSIEAEINGLIEAGNEAQADIRCIEFIEQISKAQSALVSATNPEIKKVAEGYGDFIRCIDQILFARKNILLPRQANLFTTKGAAPGGQRGISPHQRKGSSGSSPRQPIRPWSRRRSVRIRGI